MDRTTFLIIKVKNLAKKNGKTMKDLAAGLGIARGSIYWLLQQDFNDWKDEYKEALIEALQLDTIDELLEGYEENDGK